MKDAAQKEWADRDFFMVICGRETRKGDLDYVAAR